MNAVEAVAVQCPYCWESFEVVVDCSLDQEQDYVEDCSVCCRPVDLTISLGNGNKPSVVAHHDNE
ncbi:MAG TPA: CPXCG motif-containing cysteine-rich protein [Gammaproteobacteria bacterium]|jgi:hypothetical protein|nr:CPXCG motif-containing cysteine-rich protein [Gammaproteobacteria bacterium]